LNRNASLFEGVRTFFQRQMIEAFQPAHYFNSNNIAKKKEQAVLPQQAELFEETLLVPLFFKS
jgi:hypothetical protein